MDAPLFQYDDSKIIQWIKSAQSFELMVAKMEHKNARELENTTRDVSHTAMWMEI
jgi:hypothetical protein